MIRDPNPKLKIDLNIVALSIGCRNIHWSQCFNQILISKTILTTSVLATVMQSALESRAACPTETRPEVVKPVDEIKIGFKHCDLWSVFNSAAYAECHYV